MSFDVKKLYDLLPAIYRIRDQKNGEPLKEVLSVIAEEIAVIEEDLAQLYDDQFIETCAEWVVPYIGDLVGYRPPHSGELRITSPRAEVANTITYRRRKGTATVLEELAKDVTGWDARVVEFFRLLATTQYMNHIRLENQSPDLRNREQLEFLDTPFDTLPHAADVRKIASKRGRFNIPNIGIFLWRLYPFSITDSSAFKLEDNCYFFSPLGNNMQLFTRPKSEEEITHLAEPVNVPMPINRRLLNEHTDDYYGQGKSLLLSVDGIDIAKEEITVCDLSDWQISGDNYAVDPVLGRIALPRIFTWDKIIATEKGKLNIYIPENDNTKLIEFIIQKFGIDWVKTANIEKIDEDRTIKITNDKKFVSLKLNNEKTRINLEIDGGRKTDKFIVKTENGKLDIYPLEPKVHVNFHYGFSMEMGGGEYNREPFGHFDFINRVLKDSAVDETYPAVQEALNNLNGKNGAVEINKNDIFSENLEILAARDQKIELRAVNKCRPIIKIVNKDKTVPGLPTFKIRGVKDAEVTLNGLIITGGVLEVSSGIKLLNLRHCTLVPGLELYPDGTPKDPKEPSLIIKSEGTTVKIENSIVGPLHVAKEANVLITNSIVDGMSESEYAYKSNTCSNAGGELEIKNSTVIGKVHSELINASNTIFMATSVSKNAWIPPEAPVFSNRRQEGCIRFSYVPSSSKVPRRYYCQPEKERDSTRIRPQFTSLRYGDAGYCQLSQNCASEILEGADDESEMGAFHDLYQQQRITNLRVRLEEYLRFGLEAGIFCVS